MATATWHVRLPPREQHEAMEGMRRFLDSEEGRRVYARRSGIEGTISQGVRSLGLRRARYRGEAKTHLQHVATAAAMNVSRITDWLERRPAEPTRKSRLAQLAAGMEFANSIPTFALPRNRSSLAAMIATRSVA